MTIEVIVQHKGQRGQLQVVQRTIADPQNAVVAAVLSPGQSSGHHVWSEVDLVLSEIASPDSLAAPPV